MYPEQRAAAEYLNEEPDEIDEQPYNNYGLRVFSSGSMEVAVGDDDDAYDAASKSIKESLWTFKADFIGNHTRIKLKLNAVNALEKVLGVLCESTNDLVENLIDNFDDFVEDAISADGRGHFLSTWDGEENEVEIDGELYFVYRIN